MMRYSILTLLCFAFIFSSLPAQPLTALVPGITIDSLRHVVPNACRIAHDPITGNLYYATTSGDIYEVVIPASGPATETLRYSVADHGIPSLQGFAIHDSVFYLSGNDNSAGTTSIGWVRRGSLNPGGTRTWSTVATTVPYPLASPGGDHAFSNVAVDPGGLYIFANCGARTHLGEIRDNGGAWPGLREVPITTRLFRFGINATGIVLQNDSAWLDSSGYLYASGLRNPFDIAWDPGGEMFAIDNSGERDDPEELNWIREGKHYGYPWTMGGNENPIQYPGYDVDTDPMVNHGTAGYMNGWFADVPGFPVKPGSLITTEPVKNPGPDADFYREPTGGMNNASDAGGFITTFTTHRSPLGLVFDRSNSLDGVFQGDAFVTSFMPGGDSTGYSPLSPWGSPVVPLDPSRDILHLSLAYNAGDDNYQLSATRIVEGLRLPVDAVLIDSSLYVIESSSSARLWRIRFPHAPVGVAPPSTAIQMEVFPNPAANLLHISWNPLVTGDHTLVLSDVTGRELLRENITAESGKRNIHNINVESLPAGLYLCRLESGDQSATTKVIVTGR